METSAEPRDEYDRWGRRLRCDICGAKLEHPKNGRPRISCPGKCAREHDIRRKARARAVRKMFSARCPSCGLQLAVPCPMSCPRRAGKGA